MSFEKPNFRIEDILQREDPGQYSIITKYEKNQCGNCHAYLRENDRYCKKCGTKRGEGAFAPYKELMGCIYGPPPVKRHHQCNACGCQWTTEVMIDTDQYCPQCGRKLEDGTESGAGKA